MPKMKTTIHDAWVMFKELRENVSSIYGLDDIQLGFEWDIYVQNLHQDGVISDWQHRNWNNPFRTKIIDDV